MIGHGHVTPNPDGTKARCGGPAICEVCARELANKTLMDEAMSNAKERSDKFFQYFGIRGDELEIADAEHRQFLEDFSEAGMGRGFFDSPLARKAFMVGYYRGSNRFRPMEDANFEKTEGASGK